MELGFTEEQEAIRETALRFGKDKLAPGYQERDVNPEFDRQIMRDLGALGLIGAELPEEFGGLGLDSMTSGVMIEEIAYHDFNVSYIQLLGSLMGSVISAHARPEIAREIVPQIVAGELLVGLGLTEPRGGSDAANLIVKAEKKGDRYIINGEKTSISFSCYADKAIVLARTGTPQEKAHGVTAFLVDLDQPGVTRTKFNDVGTKWVGRGSLFFEEVEVAEELRLGEEGTGFIQIMQGFDYSRALIGLECLGAARASLEETWEFTTERKAFGHPIASYQGVTQPLAEAETLLAAANLLCFKTLWLRDNHKPHTAEAAMVKWWAPKLACDIIQQCLITHGHSGYSTDLPHQQRLRDVLGLQIGDGTAQIQKMIISREKVGRVAVPY